MNNKQANSFNNLFSNPIFLLLAFISVLAALFYFFNSTGGDANSHANIDYEKKDGKVAIIEYGDYQCPACINEHFVVERILSEYGDKVFLEYRHFPLPFHEYAMKAAVASECARDQGKFTEMHNALYESRGNLGVDSLRKYAGEIGLNVDIFNPCLDSDSHKDKIEKDTEQGNKDGIVGTPTFYINGRLLVNSENDRYLPRLEDFKREIDAELGK
ncbi:MAG: thioredoxin domain-containing protein [Candidatus Paceibacterota bacterium]|jgi:protein-disulfide isomerase